MSHRFFLESTPNGDSVSLDGDQARHAIQVMRFKVGDRIDLFDGTGREYHTVIEEVTKKRLSLRILDSKVVTRAVSTRIILAIALPKGDRQKFLIEKLVELGVHCLVPLKTNRSVAVANEKVIGRLQKQVVEASKQCGRNTLMEIGAESGLKQFSDALDPGCQKLIANPYQGQPVSALANSSRATMMESAGEKTLAVAIGPEGGFDDDEHELAAELGFQSLQLGPAILRVETAAMVVAAIMGIGLEDS